MREVRLGDVVPGGLVDLVRATEATVGRHRGVRARCFTQTQRRPLFGGRIAGTWWRRRGNRRGERGLGRRCVALRRGAIRRRGLRLLWLGLLRGVGFLRGFGLLGFGRGGCVFCCLLRRRLRGFLGLHLLRDCDGFVEPFLPLGFVCGRPVACTTCEQFERGVVG